MSDPLPPEKCQICGKKTVPEASPFCSDRCRKVDLNRWLGGVYAVPTNEIPDPTAESEE